jgi:glycosyltransferase involved in cell wall biosynthesis
MMNEQDPCATPQEQLDVSVAVPIYNEEECVEELHRQITAALEPTGLSYEIVAVDDGSRDSSFEKLAALHARDPRLKVIRFRRNFGQTAAFAAGFDRARGRVVITMDADLQNDPADIPLLLEKIEEGYDVVSGWRCKRKDAFLSRRLPSMVANRFISEVTGVRLHDYGCSLKAYRSEVVKNVNLYGELHRFIPAIASWMGIKVAEVRVNHRPRQFGRSKYGTVVRSVKVLLDLLTVRFLLTYSTRPIHIFGGLGLASSALGVVIGAYLTVIKFLYGAALAERPLLLFAMLLVMVGVQLITMGLLGELVVRTYHESQGKRIYVVREVLE